MVSSFLFFFQMATANAAAKTKKRNHGVLSTVNSNIISRLKNPDPIVKTTPLTSVIPPDVCYKLALPDKTIKSGSLSTLQLESVIYSCQQHELMLPDGSRAGFLIGEDAGVGKGRIISAVIFENYLRGRKRAIWVSMSTDLMYYAKQDLCDIGAENIAVHPLIKMDYSSKISTDVGVIFSSYSTLIKESESGRGKYGTRLKQLLEWCGVNFDGVIVFEEFPGLTKPAKTCQAVLELQNKLPKARIIYESATGASEPRNMEYMVRLDLGGQGAPFRGNYNL